MPPVRAYRLREEERSFLHGVMNTTIALAQAQDLRLCVKYAINGIMNDPKVLGRATCVLRPVVMESLAMRGPAIFRKMFKRHGPFKMLPKPLRGAGLRAEAKKFKLVQRTQQVRVSAAVIREECAHRDIWSK